MMVFMTLITLWCRSEHREKPESGWDRMRQLKYNIEGALKALIKHCCIASCSNLCIYSLCPQLYVRNYRKEQQTVRDNRFSEAT